MAKFKNKKTGKVVDEHLLFYVNKMRSNPSFEEVKETPKKTKEKEIKEEVEEVTPLQ